MNTTLAIWTLKWIMKLKFMKLYDEQWMKFMKVCKLAMNTMTLWMKLMKLKNAWYLFNCYEELHIISDCFELFWHWWILFLTYFWGDIQSVMLRICCWHISKWYPVWCCYEFIPSHPDIFSSVQFGINCLIDWMILLYRVKC